MRDMSQLHSAAVLIGAATLSADNTPAAVDLAGYEGCTIYIMVGIGGISFSGTNKVEFKLTASDDDSTYTAVTIDDVTGIASVGSGGIIKDLVAAHPAAAIYEVGYKGSKRYLKLLADFSGTHGTGTPIAAIALRGFPLTGPVA